jgi:stage II sporulation protein D
MASSTRAVAKLSATGRSYRNGQLVVTSIGGHLNVVNDVLLHTEYLYGIDEMPSVWGTASRPTGTGSAALEAQAIAARGYALTKVLSDRSRYATTGGLDPACGCDVYDDTRSQNYTGWAKEGGADGTVWKAAVNATVQTSAGTVTIVRDGSGAFAQTVYSAAPGYPTSTTGGTADNHDAFGTAAIPYLRHVTDPNTKKYPHLPASVAHWTDSISQATAKKVFGLSSVRSIAVTSRYSSGQVKTLTAAADNGTTKKTLTKTSEQWRTTLGLPAAWVTSFTPKK